MKKKLSISFNCTLNPTNRIKNIAELAKEWKLEKKTLSFLPDAYNSLVRRKYVCVSHLKEVNAVDLRWELFSELKNRYR